MKTQDAIAHFKTPTALARALDIKQSSIYSWGTDVPDLRQLQIERLTKGALKADAALWLKPSKAPQSH